MVIVFIHWNETLGQAIHEELKAEKLTDLRLNPHGRFDGK